MYRCSMKIIATIIVVIIGVFMGLSVVYASTSPSGTITPSVSPPEILTPIDSPTNSPTKEPTNSDVVANTFDSQAVNLRLEFHTLLREHAVLATTTLTAMLRNGDTSRLIELTDDNREKLAQKVEEVYDVSTRDRFVALWNLQTAEYKNFVIAKQNNDEEKMNKARENLQNISDRLGDLFDNAGNSLSSDAVSASMMEQNNRILNVVDPTADNNETEIVNAVKGAYDQAGELADILSRGMIQDNPQLFSN